MKCLTTFGYHSTIYCLILSTYVVQVTEKAPEEPECEQLEEGEATLEAMAENAREGGTVDSPLDEPTEAEALSPALDLGTDAPAVEEGQEEGASKEAAPKPTAQVTAYCPWIAPVHSMPLYTI